MGEGFDRDETGLGAKLVRALAARQARDKVAENFASLQKEVDDLTRENDNLRKRIAHRDGDIRALNQKIARLTDTIRRLRAKRRVGPVDLEELEEDSTKRIEHLERAIEHALQQFRGNVRAFGELRTVWEVWTVMFLMNGLSPATNWRTPQNQARLKRGDF